MGKNWRCVKDYDTEEEEEAGGKQQEGGSDDGEAILPVGEEL